MSLERDEGDNSYQTQTKGVRPTTPQSSWDVPNDYYMKSVARSYFWWPGVDKDIEELARKCQSCQAVKHAPPVAPLHPWPWPSKPWKRIHVDFAGPFQGHMFLVIVDAHAKWPAVFIMTSTTVAKPVEAFRQVFAAYGLPEQLVSDNGPQFTSEEFAIFLKQNGVKHVRCAPYHPASNGLAERFVQSLKTALKASKGDGRTLPHRLHSFLLTYRSSPHATTGVSPASLFLQRSIRTAFDLLKPSPEATVLDKQSNQKSAHDSCARERNWFIGQSVMAKNLRPGPDWIPAVIVERLGPLSFLVEMTDHQLWRRHMDQLKETDYVTPGSSDDVSEVSPPVVSEMPHSESSLDTADSPTPERSVSPVLDAPPMDPTASVDSPPSGDSQADSLPQIDSPSSALPERRYPLRERHPVIRYQ